MCIFALQGMNCTAFEGFRVLLRPRRYTSSRINSSPHDVPLGPCWEEVLGLGGE